MGCNNCGHQHVATEQTVRYTNPCGCFDDNVVESTHVVCQEPGCFCCELDPTDAEDRVALIQAGELE